MSMTVIFGGTIVEGGKCPTFGGACVGGTKSMVGRDSGASLHDRDDHAAAGRMHVVTVSGRHR